MVEFVDNNNVSFSSSMTLFYLNKSFHFRMSFSLDTIFYASTRKRLLITKTENIVKRMKQMLKHDRF